MDIIPQTIKAGARYFEIEIFNETQENDTEPVVSSGYSEGDWKLTNYIHLNTFLKKIREFIFSQELISNYQDPVFLFLNIKVNNNSITKIKYIIQ